ncbi:sulfur transporter [Paraburkholderia sp. BL27I4N3]|nr:sulfur transporter [Paraburkholderia sp. BL27I4N3]
MSDLSTSLPRVPRRFDTNPKPLGTALVLIAIGAAYLAQTVSGRQAALYLVGALLGMSLYHAAFGFTSAWRVFIADGCGAGLRAQMLMLAVGVLLFFPALQAGTLFGHPVVGLVAPAGTSVLVGAFICGIDIVSGSLHDWLWQVAAFAGNVLGTRLRPAFDLEVERVRCTGC